MTDIEELKTTIADRAAISDIECFCARRYTPDGYWYDLASTDNFAAPLVSQAAEYLKLRGMLAQAGLEIRITADLTEIA